MSLKRKVWNIGIEGTEYVSIFNLKMPSGIHVCARKMCESSRTFHESCSLCVIPPSVFNVFDLTTLFNVAELV